MTLESLEPMCCEKCGLHKMRDVEHQCDPEGIKKLESFSQEKEKKCDLKCPSPHNPCLCDCHTGDNECLDCKCGRHKEKSSPQKEEKKKCGTDGKTAWCYCGKCKPEDYSLPKDFGFIRPSIVNSIMEKLYEKINPKINQCIGRMTVLLNTSKEAKEVHALLLEIGNDLDDAINE